MSFASLFGTALALGIATASFDSTALADDGKKSEETTTRVDAARIEDPDYSMNRYPPTYVRAPIILAGAVLTLGAYGSTLGVALGWPDVPGSDANKIPVIGPWIALGHTGCSTSNPDCAGGLIALRSVLEVMSGITQVSGLVLIGEGIFMTTEASNKSGAGPRKASLLPSSITVLPIVSPTMGGIGIGGRF